MSELSWNAKTPTKYPFGPSLLKRMSNLPSCFVNPTPITALSLSRDT